MMLAVLEGPKDKLADMLSDAFCAYYQDVLYFRNGCVYSNGKRPPKIILTACAEAEKLAGSEWDIIVFSPNMEIKEELTLKSDLLVATELPSNLSATAYGVISCGMKNRHTITLSSVSDDKAVFAVQREIICKNGLVIEPMEIELLYRGDRLEYLMLVAGTLLCAGVPPDMIPKVGMHETVY